MARKRDELRHTSENEDDVPSDDGGGIEEGIDLEEPGFGEVGGRLAGEGVEGEPGLEDVSAGSMAWRNEPAGGRGGGHSSRGGGGSRRKKRRSGRMARSG